MSQPQQTQQFTVAQIDQQTQTFKTAYKEGKISFQEYRYAMDVQARNRAVAVERETIAPTTVTQTPEAKPASPLGPQPGTAAWSVQGSYVETGSKIYTNQGALVGTVGSKDMPALEAGKEYQVAPPQRDRPPVTTTTQSDYGIAAQMDVAARLGLQGLEALIGKSDNEVLKTLARAEIDYAVAPVLGAGVGGAASLESEVYGTASLINSAYKSVQEGKIQYAPVKTPILAPTIINAAVSGVFGDTSQIKELENMPRGYGMGYGAGSIASDVGLMFLGGAATGKAVGGVSKVTRFVSPKIELIGESVLARSKLVAQSGLNRISPGLGVQAEIVYGKSGASLASKLTRADAALANRASMVKATARYGLAEPLKQKAGFGLEKLAVKTGRLVPAQAKEMRLYAKSVVSPNLADYAKPIKNLGGAFKSSELYQGTKFSVSQLSGKLKVKVPVDIKVPIQQTFKGKYVLGKAEKAVYTGTVKPVKMFSKADLFKGKVVSKKNISTSDALGIAVKRKGSLRGAAYEDTFKMNEPRIGGRGSQVVKQVEKQTLGFTGKQATKVNPFAITVRGAGSFVGAYPGTQRRQRFSEDVEIVSLPHSMTDLKLQQESKLEITPINRSKFDLGGAGQLIPIIPRATFGFGADTTGRLTPSTWKPKFVPLPNQRSNINQDIGGGFIPITIPKTELGGDLAIPEPQRTNLVIPTPTITDMFKPAKLKTIPFYGRGGGSGSGGGGGALRGRWKKQTNPVKEYDKMLKDISGIKTSGKFKSSINSMDKALRSADKLGVKQRHKKSARSKRRKR